jgi:hypothetical protein
MSTSAPHVLRIGRSIWLPQTMLGRICTVFLLFSLIGVRAGPPTVNLSIGTFQGATVGSIERFLGVPYAQSPVGDKRFKAPTNITKRFSSVQNATQFGNACPQPANGLGAPVSEDCLFLNVGREPLQHSVIVG